ncbi:MAG: hypothetical protein HY744_32600 [Deltaproteobacteria bacterium]|nr:hypothetical protein [Deltaproteobacteria bacterium]
MPANFTESALRHFQDAGRLWDSARVHNADHLAGLCAECALKSILIGLGHVALEPTGRLVPRETQVHIDKLWAQFPAYLVGPRGARYLAGLPERNPFSDWRVEQRYDADIDLDARQARRHIRAARGAMKALEQARHRGDAQ